MKTKTLLTILLAFFVTGLAAQIVRVPDDYASIQSGINAASDGDTVLVSPGTYYEQLDYKGKAITVASHFIVDADTSHISGTVLDGYPFRDADTGSVVIFVSGEDTTSILSGFTIQGGAGTVTTSFGSPTRMGGGIFCLESGAKIINNKIINNHVVADSMAGGAGIGTHSEYGEYWLVAKNNVISQNSCTTTQQSNNWTSAYGSGIFSSIHSRVDNNIIQYNECVSTYAADGGGVEFSPHSGSSIKVYLRNNDIQYNSVKGDFLAFGGGVSNYYSEMVITGNIISNNSCEGGQVIYGAGINQLGWQNLGGSVLIENNEFDKNINHGLGASYGTAICIQNSDHIVTIKNNHFEANDATESSNSWGTITFWNYINKETELVLDGNILKHNSAQFGAGVSTHDSFNFRFVNNLFLGNEAQDGAAIYLGTLSKKNGTQASSVAETPSYIANNTFVDNYALTYGGAIANFYSSELITTFNNIFWLNKALLGGDIYNSSSLGMVVSNSDIYVDDISGNWVGNDNFYSDPSFQEDSLHIDLGSPCINQGADSLTVGELVLYCPTSDIDGEERPLSGGVDVGADENIMVGADPWLASERLSNISVVPNPVVLEAIIKFELESPSYCKIRIFNSSGTEVGSLLDKRLLQGKHELKWKVAGLSEGLYFISLNTATYNSTTKALVFK